jgi:hypothetical protein
MRILKRHITPISAVAESGGFLCDTERQRITQKNGAFGNQLDVLVRPDLLKRMAPL